MQKGINDDASEMTECKKYNKKVSKETCVLAVMQKFEACHRCDIGKVLYQEQIKGGAQMTTTQYCPKCKTDKPADTDHFYNDSKSKTGLSCWCKICQRKAADDRLKKKETSGKAKPEPAKKNMVLTLDFAEHDLWYEDLILAANDKLRTPEMQAIWLISESLYKERSQTDERD